MSIEKIYSLELDVFSRLTPLSVEHDTPEHLKLIMYQEHLGQDFMSKRLYVSNYFGADDCIRIRSYRIKGILVTDDMMGYAQRHVIFYTASIIVREFQSKRDINLAKLKTPRWFEDDSFTRLRTRYVQVPTDPSQ